MDHLPENLERTSEILFSLSCPFTELCLEGRALNWIEGYCKKLLVVLIAESTERCCWTHQSYITYCTLPEDPGEKDPSALSNKNRTNPFIAYQSCELRKRQCFKIFLLVANSYKIIFRAWVFIICTLSFIIAILRAPALFLFISLLLILTYSILLYIIQVTLNPFWKKRIAVLKRLIICWQQCSNKIHSFIFKVLFSQIYFIGMKMVLGRTK